MKNLAGAVVDGGTLPCQCSDEVGEREVTERRIRKREGWGEVNKGRGDRFDICNLLRSVSAKLFVET